MGRHSCFVMATLLSFLLSCQFAFGGQPESTETKELKNNKVIVQRYFKEIVDKAGTDSKAEDETWEQHVAKLTETLHQLFADDALQYFPGLSATKPDSILPAVAAGATKSMKTDLHVLVAEGDLVIGYFTHTIKLNRGAVPPKFAVMFTHQSPPFPAEPIPISKEITIKWDAMALFEIKDGKIATEWVARDDTGFDLQLGALNRLVGDKPYTPLAIPYP